MPDKTRLERLLQEIERQGGLNDYSAPRPLVSLEQFFEGNDVAGTFCANITDEEYCHVGGIQGMYRLFQHIRAKSHVQDVLVPIYGYEEEEGWPNADSIIILTCHSKETIAQWVKSIFPNEMTDITEQWDEFTHKNAPHPQQNMRCYLLWWD